jgi:branched-chain amino acid transport system permease protein
MSRILRNWWPPVALAVVVLLTWLLVSASGSVTLEEDAMRVLLWMMLVVGLQIFSGNSGIMSFGHVGFMGAGAYFAALLVMPPFMKETNFKDMPGFLASWIHPAELGLLPSALAAGLLAAVLAAIFGIAIARLSGIAAAIATLAILVIVNTFILQTPSITGGSDVVVGVPRSTTIAVASIVLIALIFLAYAFKQSRFGLRLRASRENEEAARSVAVNVRRERYIAFVVSAAVFGVVGALYAQYFNGFAPNDFYFALTFLIVAMLVVGGMHSVTGAVVGTYFLSVIYLVARRAEADGVFGLELPSSTANLLMAVALLLALILRPNGLTGGREVPLPRFLRPSRPKPAQANGAQPVPAGEGAATAPAATGAGGASQSDPGA